jgi:hypothetical protein
MICLLILLVKKFGQAFRITEEMYQPLVLIDSPQMLSRDIVACFSPVNALHLRIHPSPQNPLPYRWVYCYCFHHISQRKNDLCVALSLTALYHAKRYPEALTISKQGERTLPNTLNSNL